MSLRHKVYRVLEGEDQGPLARLVRGGITVLILANVVAVVAESVPHVGGGWARHFALFEMVSVGLFSLEYLARLWVAVEKPEYARPIAGRLRYATSFMSLVDLAAIVPSFLPHLMRLDTRMLRALRLIRLVRAFKLSRATSGSLAMYRRVWETKKSDLAVSIGVLAVLLLVSSSLMYFIEHEAQPAAFSSIPAALWWGTATLTTIGYGDIYPITAAGRIFAGIVAVIGIGVFAVPPAIFVAGIMDEMNKTRAAQARCPHCGKRAEDDPAPPEDRSG